MARPIAATAPNGGVASPRPNEICAPAERWDDTPTDPGPWDTDEDDDNEDDEANPRPPPLPPAVMGPSTTTYPRNLGWHLPNQKPCNEKGEPRKLSDITIHAITKHLTSYVIGRARPHCIVAWQERMGHALPFDKIFRSFGTPLSDATEERQWRKLVHRATFVRNRDPHAPTKKCRLCGRVDESILHVIRCAQATPLWRESIRFCTDVLGAPTPNYTHEAIILGMANGTTLLPEDSRAFLRHVYNHYYHDFANVEIKDSAFHPITTFDRAIRYFRDAAYRYGMKMKILYASRKYTTVKGTAPKEARERYPSL